MDIEKYIASGILELYVTGALSPEENLEVQHYAIKHPEIKKEIEAIEAAMLQLTKTVSPGLSQNGFQKIRSELDDTIQFLPSAAERKPQWKNYLGWAASLLFAAGLTWVYLDNDRLKTDMEVTTKANEELEELLLDARSEVADKNALLQALRDKNVTVVALGGQEVSPGSYAKAYWNTDEQNVIIDAQGLPEPPSGYDYQVWSLKLDPLTPTSIGLLEDFVTDENKMFTLSNPNASEAFGITLEPEGGSEAPTLDQLYTLGTVGP